MPSRKLKIAGRELTLDARPDRLDLRDLPFRPAVQSLPAVYPSDAGVAELLPAYQQADLILDQGREGACTGFGLAVVINYLLWVRSGHKLTASDKVSERMIYHLARFYDEWPGEDYEGSSCRGALKGWHRHGVCGESLWPYRDTKGEVGFVAPKDEWELDAVRRPLGVYYRVERESVVDIQAAIRQTGAVYVSATVHEGWDVKTVTKPLCHEALPTIKPSRKGLGGHAFALVGYNNLGFIVQNSWGKTWGASGFAVLPYDEWVLWGTDAWVVGLGAPITAAGTRTRSNVRSIAPPRRHFIPPSARTAPTSSGMSSLFRGARDKFADKKGVWSSDYAYNHTLVTANDGRTVNRLLHVANEDKNTEYVAVTKPLEWFRQRPPGEPWRLLVYAHGGLNSEEDSIQRIRLMGPQIEANGIYPLFVTWKSGWQETIGNMLEDGFQSEFGQRAPAEGIGEALSEATDRAVEVLARQVLARSLWSEMKENVARAAASDRGFCLLAGRIKELAAMAGGKLEVHLLGHSAGSYVLGRLLGELGIDPIVKAASCTLYAPACDLEFALQYFKPAVEGGCLPGSAFRVHLLGDRLERADSIGPYRKSLLYLVSRALERWHKTPLLGQVIAWDPQYVNEEHWHKDTLAHVRQWQTFAWPGETRPGDFAEQGKPAPGGYLAILNARQVDCGPRKIASNHGCFDNSVEVVGHTLKGILGGELAKNLDDLDF
jgi:hypothetical protein